MSTDSEWFVTDLQEYNDEADKEPWNNEIMFFKDCLITPVAYLTIISHSIAGNDKEIMGVLTGKWIGRSFCVTDAFRLPFLGIETAIEIPPEVMILCPEFLDLNSTMGRNESLCGWYHSHPNLSCFFSPTDVKNHMRQQSLYKAFCGIVIDPYQTVSLGEVEMKCFVLHPKGRKPQDFIDKSALVPKDKMQEFKSTAGEYYEIPIKPVIRDADQKIITSILSSSWKEMISDTPLVSSQEGLKTAIESFSYKAGLVFGKSRIQNDYDNVRLLSEKIVSGYQYGIKCQTMKHRTFFGK